VKKSVDYLFLYGPPGNTHLYFAKQQQKKTIKQTKKTKKNKITKSQQ